MNFTLTPEQLELQEVVRRLLRERAPLPVVREQAETGQYDKGLWTEMSEMGLHALAIPEEYGGLGASFMETAVVLREMGRTLHYSPYFATVILATQAIIESGDTDAMARHLPRLASGELAATLAVDATASNTVDPGPLTAARDGDGTYHVDGTVSRVLTGMWADVIIVLAETEHGPSLFTMDAAANGVHCDSLPTLDPTRPLARISFHATPAVVLGTLGAGSAPVERTLMKAAVALSAEQVGGAETVLDMATSYAAMRQTFGRAIGSYQGIKHKTANMFMRTEAARGAVDYAAWCLASEHTDIPFASASCKTLSTEAYVGGASDNIQIHGGIGFTWEHDAHLYLRRARAGSELFGSSTHHLETVADLMIAS